MRIIAERISPKKGILPSEYCAVTGMKYTVGLEGSMYRGILRNQKQIGQFLGYLDNIDEIRGEFDLGTAELIASKIKFPRYWIKREYTPFEHLVIEAREAMIITPQIKGMRSLVG